MALLRAIGLMSGTSMDGIDVAGMRTDGDRVVERGPSLFVPYEAAFRRRIEAALETAKTIERREERPGDLGRARDARSRSATPPPSRDFLRRCAGEWAQRRCHRLPRPDRSASAGRGADGPARRRRAAGARDRPAGRLRHARQRHGAWRAGRAAGAGLSRGAGPLAARGRSRVASRSSSSTSAASPT